MSKEQEVFKEWLSNIDVRVFDWAELVQGKINFSLDFSDSSLVFLEGYLLKNYEKEALKESNDKSSLDAIVSYIGEVFIRNIEGCEWKLYEDSSFVYHNLPCIKPKYGSPLSMHRLLQEVIEVRSGHILNGRFNAVLSTEETIRKAVEKK